MEARHDHSACVLGKVMYIFGGHDKDVYKLDTDTMVWSLINAKGLVPPASASHSATIIGTKMFVFGGLGHQGAFDSSIRVFNTVTNRWLSIPSQPLGGRINHSAFAYNGELYIFGGNNFERCFDELWKFNPATFSWKQGERLSGRLNCVCSCMVGGRIFLFGGGNTPDDLYIVDLQDSFKTLSKKLFSTLLSIRDSKRQPV